MDATHRSHRAHGRHGAERLHRRRDLVLPDPRRERRQHLRDHRDPERVRHARGVGSFDRQTAASDLTILSSWTVPQSELYSIPTSARPRRSSLPSSMVCPAAGRCPQQERPLLRLGPEQSGCRSGVADDGSPIPPAAPSRSSQRLGMGHDVVRGRRQHHHQRHELLREHLGPQPGDRRLHLADCVQGSMTAGITEVPGMLIDGLRRRGQDHLHKQHQRQHRVHLLTEGRGGR